MAEPTLQAAVAAVVEAGNCSGCGACALMDDAIRIERSADGYDRPRFTGGDEPRERERDAGEFLAVCPGSRHDAARPAGSRRDALFGPYISVWSAHAADPDIRHMGSSGGAITALARWLVSSGRVARAVTAGPHDDRPSNSASRTVTDPGAFLDTAGSRYGPVATLANPEVLAPDSAVVAKPCEASALTALARQRGTERPVTLSFFCAGVPSQHATDGLVEQLGVDLPTLAALRYRGEGWPGHFKATRPDGTSESITYEESWGEVLGRALQWRCKICPDGVGESSDITAGDFWESDERGYPIFTEAGGRSVLIARTERGHRMLAEAIADGVIVAAPADIGDLRGVQPLQVNRRSELAARLAGVRAAGQPVPRYRGYGLWALAMRRPRRALRSGVGAFKRARRGER
jgi:coenzyme F420 hydrogenase subunit beta